MKLVHVNVEGAAAEHVVAIERDLSERQLVDQYRTASELYIASMRWRLRWVTLLGSAATALAVGALWVPRPWASCIAVFACAASLGQAVYHSRSPQRRWLAKLDALERVLTTTYGYEALTFGSQRSLRNQRYHQAQLAMCLVAATAYAAAAWIGLSR